MPRDLSGDYLIKLLKPYGYTITRQSDSYIRLTTSTQSQHHITIPNHDPLKTGTLSAILSDIANHFGISKEELLKNFLLGGYSINSFG